MTKGFIKFQRLYRQYREETHQMRTETRWRREKELNEDITRKRHFRKSLNKNLETLEYVPANRLDEYFVERQDHAAKKIQAAFRGTRVRKQLPELRKERTRWSAAIIIQRQVSQKVNDFVMIDLCIYIDGTNIFTIIRRISHTRSIMAEQFTFHSVGLHII